ncbi:MAG: lysylphosphatidylglycerol synthase transmembrane domain-containing protein [Erysipelotrichales bacterium]
MLKNNKRNFIIVLIIAFIVMFFSFKNDYENIIEVFRNINYGWLFVAVMAVFFNQLIDTWFIYYYCKRHKKEYKFFKAYQVQQSGVFFSAITPSNSGGQFAQVLVLSKQGINTKLSASMLMLSFISWQTILVVFSFFVLIFNYSHMITLYSGFISVVFITFIIDTCVICGLFLLAFSKKFHHFIFSKIIPFLGKIRIIKDVEGKKQSTEDWLKLFRMEFNNILLHKEIMLRRVLTDFAKLLTIYTVPFLSAKALNVDIGFEALTFTIVLASFVYMMSAFVPLPGASGGAEGAFVILFGVIFGASTTAVMLLWRFLTYYLPMFVSFGFFATIKELKE